MIPYNQLSLADIFSHCQDIYDFDKPEFLSLLKQHIDLDEIVPVSFQKRFYKRMGRTRTLLCFFSVSSIFLFWICASWSPSSRLRLCPMKYNTVIARIKSTDTTELRKSWK